jgi:hypothetical protein
MSDHSHPHHEHSHSHAAGIAAVPTHVPGLSLLRLSAVERLAGVGVVIAALWAAVYWALY